MIASLRGKLTNISGNTCEVEVGGVGYAVWVGWGFLRKHQLGDEVAVKTHMAVSENDISLFGFETTEEVVLFKMLLTVSGIGPKTAAQILSESNSLEVMKAIGDADVAFFQKIKGIGKKSAQRIIVDLKSRIGGLRELDLAAEYPLLEDDLFLSLKQLGFERKEIERVIRRVPAELIGLEERLSWCLRNLG